MLRRQIIIIAVTVSLLSAASAVIAAGPVGHFLMGKQLISNINNGRCQVGPELKAILKNPEAQRAFEGGAVGPDIWEEKSHYNDTAGLAGKMLNDAMAEYRTATVSGDKNAVSKSSMNLAFAYGWYTHCAEDLNVHPRVNARAGDTFRYCNKGEKAIHATQEAQLTAYLQSVAGKAKYDVYVPFDFLSKHVGVRVDDLKASEAKLRGKVIAELFGANKVKMTDQIRESWRAAVNGSMRDAESFLAKPSTMHAWDLDSGRISTAEFDELRRLAIEANGGKLPKDWGKIYMALYEKTKGMKREQKLAALKLGLGVVTAHSAKPSKQSTKPVKKTSATGGKKIWAWVLTETKEYAPSDNNYTISGGSGNYSMKWDSHGCYASGCPGEKFGLKFTWNQPPKIIKPNETIKMTISGSVNDNTLNHYSGNASMDVFFDRIDIDPGFYGGGPGLGGIKIAGKTDRSGFTNSIAVKGSPGRGYESAGKMALIVALYNGRCAGTKYIYEWKLTEN